MTKTGLQKETFKTICILTLSWNIRSIFITSTPTLVFRNENLFLMCLYHIFSASACFTFWPQDWKLITIAYSLSWRGYKCVDMKFYIARIKCFIRFTVHHCSCSSSDDIVNLHDSLFKNYKNNVRPVRNQHDAVHVNISFNIIMIHDLVSAGQGQVVATNNRSQFIVEIENSPIVGFVSWEMVNLYNLKT